MDVTYKAVLDGISSAFAVIFVFEIIIKMTAFTPRGYFSSYWNLFDFIVVVSVSFCCTTLSQSSLSAIYDRSCCRCAQSSAICFLFIAYLVLVSSSTMFLVCSTSTESVEFCITKIMPRPPCNRLSLAFSFSLTRPR